MAGINKVILIGNLGRDPEIRYMQSGSPVASLNIATTRRWRNKQTNEMVEETEWHRVSVFGQQAEHCGNYLSKGRMVYVEGRLKTRSYDEDFYAAIMREGGISTSAAKDKLGSGGREKRRL